MGMNSNNIRQEKKQLRTHALRERSQYTPDQCAQAGEDILELIREQIPSEPSTIACYISMGTEISTFPVMRALLSEGHRLLVPRLGSGNEIGWSYLSSADELDQLQECGTHRPQEPNVETLPAQALVNAQAILLPALLVNHHGIRLGRGGAWYDRALCHRSAKAPLICIVWDHEFIDAEIPEETHDIPVDAVLTPARFTVLND